MKNIGILFITTITLIVSASAHASDNLRVVVFGDSLTSGYQLQPQEAFPVKLQKKLKDLGYETVETINMSNSGDSTTDGMGRVDELLQKNPDVVVLAYGTNDAVRGISPANIFRNISFIAAHLQQAHIYTILMGIKAPAALGNTYDQELQAAYSGIATNYSLPFYPNALEGIAEKSKLTVADGYRPNAQGVDIMVEGMYRLVDAGLRWRISVLEYQNQVRQSQQPAAQ